MAPQVAPVTLAGRLCAALSLAGFAVFLSFWVLLVALRSTDSRISGDLLWSWLVVSGVGLGVALVFGVVTVATSGLWSGRARALRRTAILLLATFCVLVALFFVGKAYAIVVAVLVLLAAGFAAYQLWRAPG
ncbi:MAG TPA: hypothetical protein VFT91_00980 [Dehalococcoidia bacterium]|nr:hypothetical protein [Dehalococcoidia bacterium]